MKRIVLSIGIVVLLGVLIFGGIRTCNIAGKYPSSAVRQGTFRIMLYQIGELQAVQSTNITPSTWGKLAELVPDGTIVEKNHVVARMETEDLEKEVEAKLSALKIAKTKLEKVQEESRLNNRENELSVQESQSNLEFERAQLQNAVDHLEKTRRLVEANLSPRQSLQEAELQELSQELKVQNSEIALEKAMDNRKSRIEMNKSNVQTAKIEVEKAEAEYQNARDRLEKAIIRAPTSGIVMYKKIWKGGEFDTVEVGDQVGVWHAILEIPDLSEMQMMTQVDEVDIAKLKVGMPAKITLDAYPDLILTGEISKISTLAKSATKSYGGRSRDSEKSARKIFEVFILIEEKIDGLRPGVTGYVEILTGEHENVIYIPIEALFGKPGSNYVYVKGISGFHRKSVRIGESNHFNVIIEEGLKDGQDVLMVDPMIHNEGKSY